MKLKVIVAVATALVLGATAGAYGIHAGEAQRALRFTIERRMLVVEDEARRAPPGEVMVIGDSITERSGISRLCGQSVFNAGVASATAEDVAVAAKQWIEELHPSRVIIAIGVNDAKVGANATLESYNGAIRSIVASAGVPVGLVAINRIEDKAGAEGFSQDRIDALNSRLTLLAAAYGLPLTPVRRFSTIDGVHLDDAGNRAWIADLEQACHGGYRPQA